MALWVKVDAEVVRVNMKKKKKKKSFVPSFSIPTSEEKSSYIETKQLICSRLLESQQQGWSINLERLKEKEREKDGYKDEWKARKWPRLNL